jgi:hypothetical protein
MQAIQSHATTALSGSHEIPTSTYKVPAEAAAAQTQAQFYACVSSSIRCAGGKGAK